MDVFGTVQRLQFVRVEAALKRQEGAVNTKLRGGDAYKAAPKDKRDPGQGALDL